MNAPAPSLHPEIDSRPAPAALRQALSERFGPQCSAALVVREQHGRDESSFSVPPWSFPRTRRMWRTPSSWAARFKVPVIPFGVGSSLEGHLLALQEADAGAIAMMRAIKQALDPGNVMNPGKIFR